VNQQHPHPISELLIRWKAGDDAALDELVPLLYMELRDIARYHLQKERPGHTLQSAALVHEAYVRLVGQKPFNTENRAHFLAIASRLMRQILVDYARSHGAAKRGADRTVELDASLILPQVRSTDVVALDDALNGLAKLLRGDLDWITLKALEKDRERRYGTPFELAADIERYLENRPVVARPARLGYRLRKYIRRNRAAVAVATASLAILVAFIVTQAMQLRRITRERDRADRITEFMTNMFKVSDPSEARGNSIKAREILDRSSKEIDTGLTQDPDLKAQMLLVMGTVYQKLGLYVQAESFLSRGIEIRTRMLGPEHPDTLKAKERMSPLFAEQGRFAEGEKFDRELLASQRRVLGPNHRETLATQSELFWILDWLGRSQEGEKLGRATLEEQQRALGTEDPDTLLSMRRLGSVLESVDRLPEAEAMTRQIVEIRNRISGPEHPETLLAMSDLGLVLVNEGRPAEAEKILRETLAMQRRVLSSDHQNSIATMNSLAIALQHQQKLDEAESLYREALDTSRRVLGPEHPGTLMEMGNLGTVFQDRKQYLEAEKVEREVLAIRRRTLGPDHPSTALAMFNIADVLHHEGRNAAAAALFRETVDIQRRVLGPTHSDTLDSL
jgi:eukaryotic-like serine/threonine-protein kinase